MIQSQRLIFWSENFDLSPIGETYRPLLVFDWNCSNSINATNLLGGTTTTSTQATILIFNICWAWEPPGARLQ